MCRALEPFGSHFFTSRAWPLGSAQDGDSPHAWLDVAAAAGIDAAHLARAHQVHGTHAIVADPRSRPDADIIVSDNPRVALAIQTADCVPLLIADRVTGAIAAAHAGWRGLAAGVPRAVVAVLTREFGSAPADLVAAVGPSICAERYEVGEDVRERLVAAGFSTAELARWLFQGVRPGHWQFDGWRSAQDQLEAAGLTPANIHIAAMCTATYPDLFCSYRRDGKGAGRIAAAIRISPATR